MELYLQSALSLWKVFDVTNFFNEFIIFKSSLSESTFYELCTLNFYFFIDKVQFNAKFRVSLPTKIPKK